MFINVRMLANTIFDQLIPFVNYNVAIISGFEDYIKFRDHPILKIVLNLQLSSILSNPYIMCQLGT